MIRLLIGVGLAISMAGCPLKPSSGGTSGHGSAQPGERTERGSTDPGDASPDDGARCDPQQEASHCNGADEDCDGLIDEGCGFHLGGYLVGAGVVSAQGAGLTLAGGTGTQHFIGSSSDGAWTIQAGLGWPKGGE